MDSVYLDYLDNLTQKLLELAERGAHVVLHLAGGRTLRGRLFQKATSEGKKILSIEYLLDAPDEEEEGSIQEIINPLHIVSYSRYS